MVLVLSVLLVITPLLGPLHAQLALMVIPLLLAPKLLPNVMLLAIKKMLDV